MFTAHIIGKRAIGIGAVSNIVNTVVGVVVYCDRAGTQGFLAQIGERVIFIGA